MFFSFFPQRQLVSGMNERFNELVSQVGSGDVSDVILFSFPLSVAQISALVDAIHASPKVVRRIVLNGCKLDNSCLEKLLPTFSSLHYLDLSGSLFQWSQVPSAFSVQHTFQSLRYLCLSGNHFTSLCVFSLCRAMEQNHFCSLRDLDLSHCHMSDSSVSSLCFSLAHCVSLVSVSLDIRDATLDGSCLVTLIHHPLQRLSCTLLKLTNTAPLVKAVLQSKKIRCFHYDARRLELKEEEKIKVWCQENDKRNQKARNGALVLMTLRRRQQALVALLPKEIARMIALIMIDNF